MNLVVLIKRVPDTETRIQIKDGKVVTEGISWIISPYDEYGVEEALRLIEKNGGKVTLLCLGPDEAKETIRKGLALGADDAIQHGPGREADQPEAPRIIPGHQFHGRELGLHVPDIAMLPHVDRTRVALVEPGAGLLGQDAGDTLAVQIDPLVAGAA